MWTLYVLHPEVSALEHDIIEVDPDTKDMLKMLDFNNINGLASHNSKDLSSHSLFIWFGNKKFFTVWPK